METSGKYILTYGASGCHNAAYAQAARELGQLIARQGYGCVNGAGRSGLMRAVTDGVLSAGGTAVGVIPQFMVDNGWAYEGMSRIVVTGDMHERKERMMEMACAIVAMPGGCGTLEELLEAITWRQLNLMAKPIVLLNTQGYFNHLLAMLWHCIGEGFMKPSHAALWTVADTPKLAVQAISQQLSAGVVPAEDKY